MINGWSNLLSIVELVMDDTAQQSDVVPILCFHYFVDAVCYGTVHVAVA